MGLQRPTFADGTPPPKEEGVQSVKQAMSIFDDFLSRDKWVAGPNMTIADISFGTIITMLQVSICMGKTIGRFT